MTNGFSRPALCVGLGLLFACAEAPNLNVKATAWPEANRLFSQDPLWIGGDGAYSCDLGPNSAGQGRVLWLFGDSLVAKDVKRDPGHSYFIRNSIAIQTGYDPSAAWMAFHWGQTDGRAGSYFVEVDKQWFWPGPCAVISGKLYIFGGWLYQKSPGMWGFASVRSTVFVVDNPSADPTMWQPQELALAGEGTAVQVGTAGLVRNGYWYVYGQSGDWHHYHIARFALADIAADNFTQPEVFGDGHWRSWQATKSAQDVIMPQGAPESSVHFDDKISAYVMAHSEGFGSTTLALRTATLPQGPWSPPQTVLRPPESFVGGNFVYAGKGHPHLKGADLVLTYVPTQFNDVPTISRKDWYLPHFAKVNLTPEHP